MAGFHEAQAPFLAFKAYQKGKAAVAFSGAGDVDERQAVMTAAVLEAGQVLGLNQAQIGRALGISASAVSRMASGAFKLDPDRKEWELARLILRVFRSLSGILGQDDGLLRRWMLGQLKPLGGRPLDLVQTAVGLVRVADYLDAMRARV